MFRTILLTTVFFCAILCTQAQAPFSLTKQAKKAYRSGNYPLAIDKTLESLSRWPNGKPAQRLLIQAFSQNAIQSSTDLERLDSFTEKFVGDTTVGALKVMLAICTRDRELMGERLEELPQALKELVRDSLESQGMADYVQMEAIANERMEPMRLRAAEMHYLRAKQLTQYPALDSNRLATFEFRRAMRFVPGYKDAAELMKEAQIAGTKRVAIVPFAATSSRHIPYARLFSEQLYLQLSENASVEFIEFVPLFTVEQTMDELGIAYWSLNEPSNLWELGEELEVDELFLGEAVEMEVGEIEVNRVPKEDSYTYKDTVRWEELETKKVAGKAAAPPKRKAVTEMKKVTFTYLETRRSVTSSFRVRTRRMNMRQDQMTPPEEQFYTQNFQQENLSCSYQGPEAVMQKAFQAHYSSLVSHTTATPIPTAEGRLRAAVNRGVSQEAATLLSYEETRHLRLITHWAQLGLD